MFTQLLVHYPGQSFMCLLSDIILERLGKSMAYISPGANLSCILNDA
jgi:hypothetical protein